MILAALIAYSVLSRRSAATRSSGRPSRFLRRWRRR